GIGGEIALRVGCRARALTQHVEGIAQRRLHAGALERFLDRLSEHEMRAQEPHRLPRGGAHGGNAKAVDATFWNRIRGRAGMGEGGRRGSRGEADRGGALDLTGWEDKWRVASLSSISRSGVAASGTRSSASASTRRASPSLVDSE